MNNILSTTAISRLLLASAAVVLLAACAGQASKTETGSQQPTKQAFEPWDGDGMDIPLDGSSLAAFETSLARVKAHTDADQYVTLINAIDYLLLYDLSAKRDRAKLAANLDGLTPKEVIDRVIWQKDSPGSGERPGRPQEAAIDL